MEIESVKKIRDRFKLIKNNAGNPAPLSIIFDNLKMTDERYAIVTWDDEEGIIYVTRLPESIHGQTGLRAQNHVETMATTYEHIQFITVTYTFDRLEDNSEFATAMGYSKELVEYARKHFKPTEVEMTRNLMTKEQVESLQPDKEWIKAQYDFDHSVKPKV